MATTTANTNRERHFIFGYGSLICHRSRAITAPLLAQKPAEAVVVEHLTRTWSKRIHHEKSYCKNNKSEVQTSARKKRLDAAAEELDILGQTAMGIERAINKSCNGVLIEVDNLELQSFDIRERGYDRVEINAVHIWKADDDTTNTSHGLRTSSNSEGGGEHNENVHIVLQKASHKRYISSLTYKERSELSQEQRNGNFDEIKVWVFLPRMPLPANRNFPIVQSYVDIILRGCLDYGNEFLDQFLSTTHGWSRSNPHHCDNKEEGETNQFIWLEDRSHPFYIRADVDWSKDEGKKIDQYLQKSLPQAFRKRKPFNKILGATEKDEEEFD